MRPAFLGLAALLLLGGCVTSSAPQYSLIGDEKGVFRSANAGRPIPLDDIKGMDERQLQAAFGVPVLDRRDATTRVLRYQSDACMLFVYVSAGRAIYADAYDPQMRQIAADQCAGSVAAQKRRVA